MAEPQPARPDETPVAAVPAVTTSPIEATLRILLSSVPYLIGAAVVRTGEDAGVVAETGKVPWLFDRRLTSLEISDDQLPPNRPVLLDWPMPYQAEWVGAPARLLVARLVAFDRTVGVLLGTLITREQLQPQTRDALDLSSQLIASAVATDTIVRLNERQGRRLRLLNELQRSLSTTLEARVLGRILKDAVNEIVDAQSFAVSLFHPQRPEVAYRYLVVDDDPLSAELGRQAPDDGPDCAAVRQAERFVVFRRPVELPVEGDATGRTEPRAVAVLQAPMIVGQDPIGVVTLQTLRAEGFPENAVDLVLAAVDASANYFAHARRLGQMQGVADATRAVAPSAVDARDPASAPTATVIPFAPPVEPPPAPEPIPLHPELPAGPDLEGVLRTLLAEVDRLGVPRSFIALVDEAHGGIRGHRASESLHDLDRAVGISAGTFLIPADDRYNAIARACREGRVVTAAWAFELVQPVFTWQHALVFERLAGGGRSTVVPMKVGGEVAGAVVLGPCAEELAPEVVERVRVAVDGAGRALAGESAAVPPDDVDPRLAALGIAPAPLEVLPQPELDPRLRALRSLP